jgi:hypothetical protein
MLGVGGFGLQTTERLVQATSFNVRSEELLKGGRIKRSLQRVCSTFRPRHLVRRLPPMHWWLEQSYRDKLAARA